jgi:hypothetical protein
LPPTPLLPPPTLLPLLRAPLRKPLLLPPTPLLLLRAPLRTLLLPLRTLPRRCNLRFGEFTSGSGAQGLVPRALFFAGSATGLF